MSNTRKARMSTEELRQLAGDWHRAEVLERMARDLAPADPADPDECATTGHCVLDPRCCHHRDCNVQD